ncbi:MAG: hypothetical protein ACP5QT_01295 [Brevinematia bacterium]
MFQGLNKKLYFLFILLISTRLFSITDEEKIIFYQDLLVNPMDINTTRIEYLQEVLNLTPTNIILFEEYRRNNYFTSLYELTNFGLTSAEIKDILPYITIKYITNKEIYFNYRILTKQRTLNNTNTNYQAFQSEMIVKNLQLYFGMKSYSNIIDEGYATNTRYNIKYEDDFIKAIFGHYQLSFGQSLLFGTSSISAIDKINQPPIYKRGKGIVSYKSLTDDFDNDKNYDYLNGFAFNLKINDNLFPFFSVAEQIIRKTNSIINFTSSLLYKENFEVGVVYNYIHSYTNQFSFFYDFIEGETFHPYGEISFSDGFSTLQGIMAGSKTIRISTLIYYSESNFNSINGQKIIDYKKDVAGFFAGIRYEFESFFIQLYLNLYIHSTNEKTYQKYEIRAGIDIDNPLFSTLSIELKSRYSDILRTRNLRSFAYIDAGILRDRIILELRYQNLLEFDREEMGNMFLSRLRLYLTDFLKLKGRVIFYKAKSYYSDLYYTEEDFFRGDFSINSYYGIGSEYAVFSELKIAGLFALGAGYSYDRRRIENLMPRNEHRFSLYLEGEW